MQTSFTLAQLADPQTAESEKILRACVHCGFCTATCPTYVLLGDELDSPRGRIYLIKEMLENDRPATPEVVKHIDRCLSCLACMTTCPSGVHYMHLVDHARDHIEKTYKRPLADRLMRGLLAKVLPNPGLFRLAVVAGWLGKPFAPVLRAIGLKRAAAMLRAQSGADAGAAGRDAARSIRPRDPAVAAWRCWPAASTRCWRRPPTRPRSACSIAHGIEVVVAAGRRLLRLAVAPHGPRGRGAGLCPRQYRCLDTGDRGRGARRHPDHRLGLRHDGEGLRLHAAHRSGLCRQGGARFGARQATSANIWPRSICRLRRCRHSLTVAYHAACSLQHGQKVVREPKDLLSKFGFIVKDIPEGHLCCGSAGTYNILQPSLADRLRDRKVANIERLQPDVIAAGNIGCITQIAAGTAIPVVHTVELIDWATGGPMPEPLRTLDVTQPEAAIPAGEVGAGLRA